MAGGEGRGWVKDAVVHHPDEFELARLAHGSEWQPAPSHSPYDLVCAGRGGRALWSGPCTKPSGVTLAGGAKAPSPNAVRGSPRSGSPESPHANLAAPYAPGQSPDSLRRLYDPLGEYRSDYEV
jgi:hypothetical protein